MIVRIAKTAILTPAASETFWNLCGGWSVVEVFAGSSIISAPEKFCYHAGRILSTGNGFLLPMIINNHQLPSGQDRIGLLPLLLRFAVIFVLVEKNLFFWDQLGKL